MDLNHSPGFPYKRDFRTKAHALEHPDIRRMVESGDVWSNPIWDSFGKFEILPFEKAEIKCRCITSTPVTVAVVVASWYEAMNESLMDLCYDTPYGIGMCKGSGHWNRVLQRFKGSVWQCDASGFDSCLRPYILEAVYEVRDRLLDGKTPEYWLFRREWLNFLIHGLIRDHHTGSVYAVSGGNKSGSPNTASDNTIANMICCAYAMLRCGIDPSSVPWVCYGDDMLVDGMVPYEMWEHYQSLGLVIKPEAMKHVERVEDAEFLSCTSRKLYGQYVPVWKADKAAYSMMSTDSKKELREGSRFQSLLLEALFTEHWKELQEIAAACGHFRSWDSLLQIFLCMEGLEDTKENG